VLLARKALANNLTNGSQIDEKWQLWMLFLKPALRAWKYTSFEFEATK